MEYISLGSKNLVKPYDSLGLNKTGKRYSGIGEDILRNRKLGVVILSGGQGTRLCSKNPKGLFEIKNRSLFEWHVDTIKELIKKYNADIKLFVMTSSYTDKAVREHFQEANFGLNVSFFKQRNSICVDVQGKPLVYYDGYAEAPYGNGDVFNAIQQVNIEKVEVLNIISIDNVLAQILDPVFVGAFYDEGFDVLSKAVTKREGESVGAFLMDGKLRIKEYGENDVDGEGIQGNICNHLFKTSFVKRMRDVCLPEHKAFKKIPYTENGVLINPEKPNGFKKETFIFDSFEYVERNGVMNVPREVEFSPLKNGMDSSVDNPTTCATAIEKYRIKTRS